MGSIERERLPQAIIDPVRKKEIHGKSKALFFSGYSLEKISVILDLDEQDKRQVDIWINGKSGTGVNQSTWRCQIRSGGDLAVKTFIHAKAAAVENTAGLALKALTQGIKNFCDKIEGGYEAKTKELKDLSDIVTSLDKIWRLENEQATEIIQRTGFSREEAMRIILADPFAPKAEKLLQEKEVIDVDYKQI